MMPALLLLAAIIVAVVIVALFIRDAQQPRRSAPSRGETSEPEQEDTVPVQPRHPRPAPSAADTAALNEHVRELRRAVDQDLIGRDEAIESIVRQANGALGTHSAAQLLDSAEPGADPS